MTGTGGTAIDIVPTATTGAMIGAPNAPSGTIADGPPATTADAAKVVGMIGGATIGVGGTGSGGRSGSKANRLRAR